jgi:hypothetical protein
MPKGPEYVEAALAKIERISAAIGGAVEIEEGWKADAQGRLAALVELLHGMGDRFFLKTRVCLPFARQCDQSAAELETLVGEALANERGGQQELDAALEALEKTVRTLDERSMMQGMSIT